MFKYLNHLVTKAMYILPSDLYVVTVMFEEKKVATLGLNEHA